MKTFAKIVVVVLVIVLIVAAVIGFIETPVIAEGEEPTKAQALILAAKEHLDKILAAVGLSLDAALMYIFMAIQKTSAATQESGTVTTKTLEETKAELDAAKNELQKLAAALSVFSKKQDVSNKILTDTLLASDMPSETRAKINNLWDTYLAADTQTPETPTVAPLATSAQEPATPVQAPTVTAEPTEQKSAPSYF